MNNPQYIDGWTVRVGKTDNQVPAVRVQRPGAPSRVIPCELLGLAAGPDVWMRKILLNCAGCHRPFQAGALEGGFLCPSCLEEAEQENERLDNPTKP